MVAHFGDVNPWDLHHALLERESEAERGSGCLAVAVWMETARSLLEVSEGIYTLVDPRILGQVMEREEQQEEEEEAVVKANGSALSSKAPVFVPAAAKEKVKAVHVNVTVPPPPPDDDDMQKAAIDTDSARCWFPILW